MSDDRHQGWGLAAAHLPERLDGCLVLEVGPPVAADLLGGRGIETPMTVPWPSEEVSGPRPYDLAYLATGLDGEAHPLTVGAWVWWRLAEGGTLVVESTILADPANTAFAEFVTSPTGSEERWRWLPGRLALRWMIENSGFDGFVWLGERPGQDPKTVDVCLQATRTGRPPALDLARQPLVTSARD